MLFSDLLRPLVSQVIARGILLFFRPQARVTFLDEKNLEEVAQLLTEQFCLREPLSRNLRLTPGQLRPFFREQVTRAVQLGLALVVLSPKNEVLGAVIMEDHADPYVPSQEFLLPEFVAIGELLNAVPIPDDLTSTGPGEVLYCALVAVKPGAQKAPILTLITAAVSALMLPKGYKKGYAKVTNPRVIATFRKMERLLRQGIFTVTSPVNESHFEPGAFAPLTHFSVAVVQWNLAFWSRLRG